MNYVKIRASTVLSNYTRHTLSIGVEDTGCLKILHPLSFVQFITIRKWFDKLFIIMSTDVPWDVSCDLPFEMSHDVSC